MEPGRDSQCQLITKSVTGHTGISKYFSDGKYRISLSRWPREADTAIDAPLPPGTPVPGARAFRETPGVKISPVKVTLEIDGIQREAEVVTGSKEVAFEVELKQGVTTLSGRFITADGEEFGTYYAYVVKH